MKYGTIYKHFSTFRKIMEGRCKVFMNNTRIYQTAYITYEEESPVDQFYQMKWSTLIGKDSVGVIPLCLSSDKRNERKERMVKLSGLPFNTTPFDLKKLTDEHDIRYCFIPRNGKTNNPVRYALMYFGTEEAFDKATMTNFSFKQTPLFWTTTNEK